MGQENTIASRTTFEYLLQDEWVQVAACVGSNLPLGTAGSRQTWACVLQIVPKNGP